MRLTTKRNGKNVIPLLNAVCGIDMPYWRIDRADDLHSYLSGDAADKLASYENADEQGRLVILPCKVGDVVWRLVTGTRGKRLSAYPQYVIYEFRISDVYGTKSLMFFGHNIISGKPSTSYEVFREDDFGKTVFLTREEAEAALKGEREVV